MAVLDRKTYKAVEWALYNYHKNRRELAEEKEMLIEAGNREIGRLGDKYNISDSTADKAMKLCSDNIDTLEKWVKVVDGTLKKYNNTDKEKLIYKKYFEELGERHICQEVYISTETFYKWRREIITFGAMLAIQEGVLKI